MIILGNKDNSNNDPIITRLVVILPQETRTQSTLDLSRFIPALLTYCTTETLLIEALSKNTPELSYLWPEKMCETSHVQLEYREYFYDEPDFTPQGPNEYPMKFTGYEGTFLNLKMIREEKDLTQEKWKIKVTFSTNTCTRIKYASEIDT